MFTLIFTIFCCIPLFSCDIYYPAKDSILNAYQKRAARRSFLTPMLNIGETVRSTLVRISNYYRPKSSGLFIFSNFEYRIDFNTIRGLYFTK